MAGEISVRRFEGFGEARLQASSKVNAWLEFHPLISIYSAKLNTQYVYFCLCGGDIVGGEFTLEKLFRPLKSLIPLLKQRQRMSLRWMKTIEYSMKWRS